MPGRIALAFLCASALLAGCDDLHRSYLLATDGAGHRVFMPRQPPPPGDPKVEASAARALKVMQKVVDANPSVSVKPLLCTVGSPKKSMFHTGNPQTGTLLYVTDSLINACTDEPRLAAVLCAGLGRAVAEAAAPALLPREGPSRIEERLGSDDRGAFGPADGTRLMEAAKAEQRKLRSKKPDPAALALGFLTKAGYKPEAMKQVLGLLREADQDQALREQLTSGHPHQPVRLLKPVPKGQLQAEKK